MTITWPDGTRARAVLLSRTDYLLRVAVEGEDDARVFCRANDRWVSESGERVDIEFDWQRRTPANVPPLRDCICPQEVANRLIDSFLHPERGATKEEALHVISGTGLRIAVRRGELIPE
ncbi:MAG TPA: hypothetical protein VMS37_01775 [Verrucomicrobiae bacterium]|nr:hypothetical protein [Verrucomicrobiae bacterium]